MSRTGSNWSVGERQLLCLARAATLRRKIIAIDEATANIDYATDQLIQTMLRSEDAFKAATIIVVAHRIKTILDSDLILVLDTGRVLEAGTPAALLATDSAFAAMVRSSASE